MGDITVIGTGYVGLVTGTCFADLGNHVTCLDIDEGKIRTLQQGDVPIYEPGLKEMVQRNMSAGRLCFTSDYEEGIAEPRSCLSLSAPEGQMARPIALRAWRRTDRRDDGSPLVIVNKSTVPVVPATG